MRHSLHRRSFLQATGALAAGFALGGVGHNRLWAADAAASGTPYAEKLGWRLGCQAYTFNRFTFVEALEKNASLGLKVIEGFPGQALSKEKPDVKFGPDMSSEIRQEVKKRLADAGVKMAGFGVVGLSKNEAESRKMFDFAKDMGAETIISEPAADAFDVVEKLCDEYEINVALHNHPKPSGYWDYKTVLAACKGRSKRIGSCADTGHWTRSGISAIEAIKALEGRIISLHLKDLPVFGVAGPEAHDVPWGTGIVDIRGVLIELRRQKFQGVFSVEYEHNWMNSVPEIAHCVGFFDGVAAELLAK
jgi:sugar phosphate isomerase/epimerase